MNAVKLSGGWVVVPVLIFGLSLPSATLAQIANGPPPSQRTRTISAQATNAIRADQEKGNTTIPQFLAQAFFTLLGGGIAGVIGILTANYNRKQNAKVAFRVFISQKFGMIDPKREQHAVLEFYRTSKSEIKSAILELRPFLNKREVLQLETLWNEYNQIDEKHLSWAFEVESASIAANLPKPSALMRSYAEKLSAV